MSRTLPLSLAVIGRDTLLTKVLLVAGGSLLVALAAQVKVPMLPVPMTLQTLAISVIGLTYGSRMAAATLVAYLIEGAIGLPVFAGASFGIATLVGPTGGFLFGFVAMAWMTGLMVERGFGKGLIKLFLAALVPGMLLYIPGAAWPVLATKLAFGAGWGADNLAMVWQYYVGPFLVGDVVKAALAALTVFGGWKMVSSRKA